MFHNDTFEMKYKYSCNVDDEPDDMAMSIEGSLENKGWADYSDWQKQQKVHEENYCSRDGEEL